MKSVHLSKESLLKIHKVGCQLFIMTTSSILILLNTSRMRIPVVKNNQTSSQTSTQRTFREASGTLRRVHSEFYSQPSKRVDLDLGIEVLLAWYFLVEMVTM